MVISEKKIKRNIRSISSEVLNGENYNRSDFARSLLNYPAMMVPSVQEPIIEELSDVLNNEVSLLDPFMGASNTLVTGMKYGMNVFGQDINPLSLLLSQVKTTYYLKEELDEAEARIINSINIDQSHFIEVTFPNIDKWFTKNVQIDLSKIFRAINKEPIIKIRKFFWVVLAEVIRLTSNDRTSTFKMHMRSLEDIRTREISVLKTFASVSKKNIKNISDYIAVLSLNIIRKTKCFDFWERNVLFPKTKRSFFRTPTPLPCPFPLNFSLLIITKKFGNFAKNRYICIV